MKLSIAVLFRIWFVFHNIMWLIVSFAWAPWEKNDSLKKEIKYNNTF